MIRLSAISSLRIAPQELDATTRTTLGQALRREGALAKVCLNGLVSCIGSSDPEHKSGRTAMVWSSLTGARVEVDRMLEEICVQNGQPMPFDFIASQCCVTSVYAARFVPALHCGIYMPAGEHNWRQMLTLAVCWLEQQRYEQVLCGLVDLASPASANPDHASDWLLLSNAQDASTSNPSVRLRGSDALTNDVADTDVVPKLQAWLSQSVPACFSLGPVEFAR